MCVAWLRIGHETGKGTIRGRKDVLRKCIRMRERGNIIYVTYWRKERVLLRRGRVWVGELGRGRRGVWRQKRTS